jgi:hypothetical protein
MLSKIHFIINMLLSKKNTLVMSIMLGFACLAAFSLIASNIFRWIPFQVFDIRNYLTLHSAACRLETLWSNCLSPTAWPFLFTQQDWGYIALAVYASLRTRRDEMGQLQDGVDTLEV